MDRRAMSLHLPTIAEEDNVSYSSGMSLSGLETVRASNIRRRDNGRASSSTTIAMLSNPASFQAAAADNTSHRTVETVTKAGF